ncbi:hypothetical protein CEP53_010590 [Fusarium sp. AF-6]|nr:hypothetical protein CEP53_010590 [Fusarium sp. AF-6]
MDYLSATDEIRVPTLVARTQAWVYRRQFKRRMTLALASHAAEVANTRHADKEKEKEKILRQRQARADRRWYYTKYHAATTEANQLINAFLLAVSGAGMATEDWRHFCRDLMDETRSSRFLDFDIEEFGRALECPSFHREKLLQLVEMAEDARHATMAQGRADFLEKDSVGYPSLASRRHHERLAQAAKRQVQH